MLALTNERDNVAVGARFGSTMMPPEGGDLPEPMPNPSFLLHVDGAQTEDEAIAKVREIAALAGTQHYLIDKRRWLDGA